MSLESAVSPRAALDGVEVRVSATNLAARVATSILGDLGACITEVSATQPADLTEAGAPTTPAGVSLDWYGSTGRWRDAPPNEASMNAIGGAALGQYTYGPVPAYLVTPFAQTAQGLLAAIAVLARRLAAAYETNDVPGTVSTLQALFSLQGGAYAYGPVPDEVRWSHTPRGQWPSYATYKCSDGKWIFVGASTTPFMIQTFLTLGLDEILADPKTHEGPRQMHGEGARPIWRACEAAFATDTSENWIRRFNDAGVPIGPVLTVEEAIAHPQVKAEDLVDDDFRIHNLVRVAKQSEGPVPPKGSGPLPLSGLRVLELTGYIAGSYTGRLLSDLGADVVKVEPPGGDPFRALGYGFAGWNYDKRGLTLNVAKPEGRQAILDLASVADIFVTNYRAESLEKFGLTRDHIFEVNPTIIHASIAAFGDSGPLASLPGFDPIVQGFVGVMQRQGGDNEPVKTQMAATDYMAAMLAALGVMAARTRQVEEGGGYTVTTSLLASATSLLFEPVEAIRTGRAYVTGGYDFAGPHPLERLYQATDGWFQVTTPVDERDAHPDAVAYLEGARADTVAQAIGRLTAMGVAAVPCTSPLAMTSEPHFDDNRMWVRVQDTDLGELTLPAPVLRTTRPNGRPPRLGESAPLEDWWAAVAARRAR
ncbi:MAG: hypothetical protein EPO65_13860 [Dehalococcoidia bacterium]|nr:MAG: hypothetical protein EPO65_13860 [Dehalococcoidia bacterium]